MSKRKQERRAKDIARMLNVVSETRGMALVAAGAVWRVDAAAMPRTSLAEWLAADTLAIPDSASPVSADDIRRLREAIRFVASLRSLDEMMQAGLRPLKRWKGSDLKGLLDDALSTLAVLEEATKLLAEGDTSEPGSVLSAGDVQLSPSSVSAALVRAGVERTWSRLESSVPLFSDDLLIALRLCLVGRINEANRWLDVAAKRWWPASEIRQGIQHFSLRLRELGRGGDELVQFAEAVEEWKRSAAPTLSWTYDRPADPGAAERILADLLVRNERSPGRGQRRGALALVLAGVGLERYFYGDTDLARELADQPQEWLQRAGPRIVESAIEGWSVPSWISSLSADLAAEVASLRIEATPYTEEWSPEGLWRYSRILRSAWAEAPRQQEWLRQGWVANVVNSRLGEAALSLALGAGRVTPGTDAALAALMAGVGSRRESTRNRIVRWAEPVVRPEFEGPLAAAPALGLERSELLAYLHYRALSGDGANLPRAAASLLDPVAGDRMASRIRQLLSEPELSADRCRTLEGELQRLEDSAVVAARTAAQRKRVVNEIRRATEQYRVTSLRSILHDVVAASFEVEVGELPLELLGGLVVLAEDRDTDKKLFRRFYDAACGVGPPVDRWRENTEWAERVAPRVAVTRWLDGFDITVDVDGTPIRYVTEKDPLLAAHMGTFFDTCLSLEYGFHRTSALTNAVEANRHVVYGFDERGNVVARKLIALSKGALLVGYRTYAHEKEKSHRRALGAICEDFAERCGVRLSNSGTPESLTNAYWYDDGIEDWSQREVGHSRPVDEIDIDLFGREGLQWSVLNRHEVTDRQIDRRDPMTWWPEEFAGLWLDERLPNATALVCEVARSHGVALWLIPTFDLEDRLTAVLEQLGPFEPSSDSDERSMVLTLPRPRSVRAAASLGLELTSWQRQLLSPTETLDFLRHSSEQCPSTFECRLLQRKRVLSRWLLPALDEIGCRSSARWRQELAAERRQHDLAQFREEHAEERIAVLSRTELKVRLQSERSAGRAAVELALRFETSTSHAVESALLREPESAVLRAAAHVLGSQYNSPGGYDGASELPWGLARALCAVRPDIEPFRDDPEFDDIREAQGDGLNVVGAVQRTETGEWDALAEVAQYGPALFDHPIVERRIITALARREPIELAELARCLAMTTWARRRASAPGHAEKSAIVFASYAGLGARDSDTDRVVLEGVVRAAPFMSRGTCIGPVATELAKLLGVVDIADYLEIAHQTGGGHIRFGPGEGLEWLLAAQGLRTRLSPDASVPQLVQQIESTCRCLKVADSDRLVDDLLSKLEPPTLVALMDAVLEPGRLTNLSSMTQLCVLAAAASAAPDEFALRLSNVEQLLARLRNSVGGSSLGREIASAHLTRLIGALKSDGTS